MSASFQSLDLSRIKDSLDDLDELNLPLIIALTSGLGVLFLFLLGLTIYFSFFNNGTIFLGSQFNIPGEFDDEENRLNEEEQYLPTLSPEERENYFAGKEFELEFLPVTNPLGSTLSPYEKEFIKERGLQAYLFAAPLESPVVVIDKLDVRFPEGVNSITLNYPLPTNTDNDTVYFEVKIFEIAEDAVVSIGLGSKPYPAFRLPGYNKYSIAYESSGTVRINQPFYSPNIWPKLIEGDVLGCGFKQRSGTIFFTHNGKKVLEAVHNVKLDLYPMIGSKGESKLDVNLGQLGFVFIEANVKKWGFGSTYGSIGVPPAFKEIQRDTVLDKGEDLPPNYPSEEDTFFGPSALLTGERPTRVINSPPCYKDEPKPELIRDDNIVEIDEEEYERRSSAFESENQNVGKSSDLIAWNITDSQPIITPSRQSNQTQPVLSPLAEAPTQETQEHQVENKDTTIQESHSEVEDESPPEIESSESTPEPTAQHTAETSPNSNNKKNNKKKKKKKGKKK